MRCSKNVAYRWHLSWPVHLLLLLTNLPPFFHPSLFLSLLPPPASLLPSLQPPSLRFSSLRSPSLPPSVFFPSLSPIHVTPSLIFRFLSPSLFPPSLPSFSFPTPPIYLALYLLPYPSLPSASLPLSVFPPSHLSRSLFPSFSLPLSLRPIYNYVASKTISMLNSWSIIFATIWKSMENLIVLNNIPGGFVLCILVCIYVQIKFLTSDFWISHFYCVYLVVLVLFLMVWFSMRVLCVLLCAAASRQ